VATISTSLGSPSKSFKATNTSFLDKFPELLSEEALVSSDFVVAAFGGPYASLFIITGV